jgi:predicted lipoprotein with Yx(FWY)xxD motif
MRIRWWAAPGAVAAVALLAACGSSGSGTASGGSSSAAAAPASSSAAPVALPQPMSVSAAGLTTATTSKGTIIVTAQGAPVYWFAIDTPTKSNCSAACLKFWPALTGTPSAAAGSSISGTFGTIKGAGGITQATYDGHPLYLFAGDKSVDTPTGNAVNASGGLWYAMTPSGAKLAAATKPAASSSSTAGTTSGGGGGGGYGY